MRHRHFSSLFCLKTSFIFCLFFLTACAGSHGHVRNHNKLKVTTHFSERLYLDPVPQSQQTIYLQVKNHSDMKELLLQDRLAFQLREKGYRLVDDPTKAHYTLQANVLTLDREVNAENTKRPLAYLLMDVRISENTDKRFLKKIKDNQMTTTHKISAKQHHTRMTTTSLEQGLRLKKAIPKLVEGSALSIAEIF